MIPRDLSYINPKAAIFFLVIFLFFALYLLTKSFRNRDLLKIADSFFLDQIAILRNPYLSNLKFLLFSLFWALSCLALMGPKGNEHYREASLTSSKALPLQDVLFLIDTSASMSARDTKTKMSRLENAKEIADQIAKRLTGNDLMLISFTTEPSVIVPLTLDNIFFRLQLKDLTYNAGGAPPGTTFLNLFNNLKELYAFDPSEAYQTVLLFSDGEDLGGSKEELLSKITSAISPKEFPHVTLYAIGLGSSEGAILPDVKYQGKEVHSKLDPTILKFLANSAGGEFFFANQFTPEDLAKEIVKKIQVHERTIAETKQHAASSSLDAVYSEYFQIPLALSLLAFLLALSLPETFKKTLCVALIFIPLFGFSSEDLLARQFFEAKEFSSAILEYQELLKKNPPDDLKRILKYNLAASYLGNKNWDEAIKQLRDLTLNGLSVPKSLQMSARYNLSYAFFEKALEEKNLLNQLYLLRLALYFVEESCTADCEFSYEINEAKLLYKGKINKAIENFFKGDNGLDEGISLSYLLFAFNLKDKQIDNFYTHLINKFKLEDAPKRLNDAKTFLEEQFNRYYSDGAALLQALIEAYIQQARDPFFEPFSIFYLKQLQKRASELFKEDERIDAAGGYLNAALAEAEKDHLAAAHLYIVEALLKIKSAIKLPEGPAATLSALINSGEAALGVQRLFAANEKELIPFKDRLLESKIMVEKQGNRFPGEVMKWQQKQFESGKCQCQPWDEVFPLFVKGFNIWRREGADVQGRLDNYESSLDLWEEALELIKKNPEGQNRESAPQEEAKNETLRELQEMQQLDHRPSPAQTMPTGGKSW